MIYPFEYYPGSNVDHTLVNLNPTGNISKILIEGCCFLPYDPFFAKGINGRRASGEGTTVEGLLSDAQKNWDAAKNGEYGTFSKALILAIKAVDLAKVQQAEDEWADIMRKVESEKNLPTKL